MKKIQTSLLKIILSITLLFTALVFDCSAQNTNLKLKKADSLFIAKLYTQSFELYNELFSSHMYSSAMLLKMAFIQEGLGHLSQSLYYLNLYSNFTYTSQTEEKIKELADKNNLVGYTDTYSQEKLYHIIHENYFQISLALVATVIFLLGIIIFQRKKNQHRPIVAGIALVGFLSLLFWQLNLSEIKPSGIIEFSHTYLMEGPSSGSSVLAIVSEGHKLKIEGKYDVWLKVQWNGKDAFIKETSLLPLKFN